MISAGVLRCGAGTGLAVLKVLLVLLVTPARARAADWQVLPSLRLRESYSDNINVAPGKQARGESSSEAAPGIALTGGNEHLALRLDYSVQKIVYSHDADRLNQQLDASAHGELARDWLYLDLRQGISQQNVSAFGPQFSDQALRNPNSSTVRTRSVSPYLRHLVRGLASVDLRYASEHVRSAGLLEVRSDETSLDLASDHSGQPWSWQLRLDRKHIADAALAPVVMDDAALTLTDALNSRFALVATAGYETNDYQANSGEARGRYWSVGGRWTPSPRTSLSASRGRRYFGKTYRLDAEYRLRQTYWTLSYDENITTTQAQLLSLPPAGLGDFLNQLWASRIPDPLLRAQTVKFFLQLSQLLGTRGNVNYFSHRYYLQKEWKLATVYTGPKSALSLGLASTGRTAQTSAAIDSLLLGPDQLALEDRTRQNSAQLGWSWRMSTRNNLSLGASRGSVESLSTGRRDNNVALTVGFSRQLQAKVSASIDFRHLRHTSNGGGAYRENGASATFAVMF
jgi:uncharacterized protein (PEP-CTERM system associated)